MEIIITNRGGGKTTELIKRAAEEEGNCIVCATTRSADYTHKEAFFMGKKIMHPITYKEFLRGNYQLRGIKKFLIDDFETFLEQLSGSNIPIQAIAISANDGNKVTMARDTNPTLL